MASKNIEAYINRDHSFQATLTSGGSTWDISAATEITFTVKKEKSDSSAKFSLTYTGGGITFSGTGSDGIINIAIADTDTEDLDEGVYLYDISVELGGEEFCPLEGKLTLNKTVKG